MRESRKWTPAEDSKAIYVYFEEACPDQNRLFFPLICSPVSGSSYHQWISTVQAAKLGVHSIMDNISLNEQKTASKYKSSLGDTNVRTGGPTSIMFS